MDLIKSRAGRFLERKNKRWVSLTPKQARDKVGHALRDAAKESRMKRMKANREASSRKVSTNVRQKQLSKVNVGSASQADNVSSFPIVNEVSESKSCKNHESCSSADWTQFLDLLLEESTLSDSDSGDDNSSLQWFADGPTFEPI
jgi:hypothetical protein